ncbi:hypothetical protein, partial [Phocaeicola barnesiae]|uniref:hypothetical protein n=1 Tax=Phocaeicola barnesiae TaxID=376804 RepID=UPI001F3E4136
FIWCYCDLWSFGVPERKFLKVSFLNSIVSMGWEAGSLCFRFLIRTIFTGCKVKIPLFLSFPAKKFVSLRLKPLGEIKNFKR